MKENYKGLNNPVLNRLYEQIKELEVEIKDNKKIGISVSVMSEVLIILLPILLFNIQQQLGLTEISKSLLSYYLIDFPILTVVFNSIPFYLFKKNQSNKENINQLNTQINYLEKDNTEEKTNSLKINDSEIMSLQQIKSSLLIYDYNKNKEKYDDLINSGILETYLLSSGYTMNDINDLQNYIEENTKKAMERSR